MAKKKKKTASDSKKKVRKKAKTVKKKAAPKKKKKKATSKKKPVRRKKVAKTKVNPHSEKVSNKLEELGLPRSWRPEYPEDFRILREAVRRQNVTETQESAESPAKGNEHRGRKPHNYGRQPEESKMRDGLTIKQISAIAGGAAILLIFVLTLSLGLGSNDDQNYQIKQSITGNVTVIDTPGWYLKMGATVWTYPRSVQKHFSASVDEGGVKDESIRVTFNDGGTAQVSAMVRFQTPIEEKMRRQAHQDFSGQVENMTQAVRAHLINCAKSSAPLMSASEHQSARKAEFSQLVEAQLTNGLYKMRRIKKDPQAKLDDKGDELLDEKGETVYEEQGPRFSTEIVVDGQGVPVIAQPSPLKTYGITILQFSVTSTDYDNATRQQFEAKKQSFLAAEKSKAEREQEVQQRLMVTEKGLREAAEAEAIANVELTKATILADQEKQVAETAAAKTLAVAELTKQEALTKAQQDKEVAETAAAQLVAVAELAKEEALVKAQQELEVAELKKQAAIAEAEAITTLAEAEAVKIDKAGALTELQQALIQAAIDRDAKVAEALSKIAVPAVIMGSGGNGAVPGDASYTNDLINLNLMKNLGLFDKTGKGGNAFKPMIVPEHAGASD
jgi:hypothetical protein